MLWFMAAGKPVCSSSLVSTLETAIASLQAGHACTVRGAISVTTTSKQPAIRLRHFMKKPLERIISTGRVIGEWQMVSPPRFYHFNLDWRCEDNATFLDRAAARRSCKRQFRPDSGGRATSQVSPGAALANP